MQKLVEMARRTLDIDQKAADAARHDNPKTLSSSFDVTESEICAHFVALARQRRQSCEESLARLQLDRKETAAKIDVEQIRDSFARLLTGVEPSLETLRSDHSTALYQAKENEARALTGPRRIQSLSSTTSRSWPRWHSSNGCRSRSFTPRAATSVCWAAC